MVAEVMLINPRKRAARAKPRRKMSALQRQYFGKRRRAAPAARSAGATRVTVAQANPRRRRRRALKKPTTLRYRRNPIGGSTSVTSAVVPGLIGAGGAFAVNYVYSNYLSSSMPASMTSGITGSLVQVGLSLGMGLLAGMAFGKRTGIQVATGAVAVSLYALINQTATGAATNAGGYSGLNGLGKRNRIRRARMGRYAGAQMAGMGGNLPPGLNRVRGPMGRYAGAQMAGNLPRNLNGLAGPGMRQQRRGMGYTGPARIAGPMMPKSGMARYIPRT